MTDHEKPGKSLKHLELLFQPKKENGNLVSAGQVT
jgi:hypothetical protein